MRIFPLSIILLAACALASCKKEKKGEFSHNTGWPENPACSPEQSRIVEVKTFFETGRLVIERLQYDDQHRLIRHDYPDGQYDAWQYLDSNIVNHTRVNFDLHKSYANHYFNDSGLHVLSRYYTGQNVDSDTMYIQDYLYHYNAKNQLQYMSWYSRSATDGFTQQRNHDTATYTWEAKNLVSETIYGLQYHYYPSTDGRLRFYNSGVPLPSHLWIYNPHSRVAVSENLVKRYWVPGSFGVEFEYLFDATGRIKAEKRTKSGENSAGTQWVYYRYECI